MGDCNSAVKIWIGSFHRNSPSIPYIAFTKCPRSLVRLIGYICSPMRRLLLRGVGTLALKVSQILCLVWSVFGPSSCGIPGWYWKMWYDAANWQQEISMGHDSMAMKTMKCLMRVHSHLWGHKIEVSTLCSVKNRTPWSPGPMPIDADQNHGIDPKFPSMPINSGIGINTGILIDIDQHWLALGIDRGSHV